jgi:ribosomal protein S27AE
MRLLDFLRHLNAPRRQRSQPPTRLIDCRRCGSDCVNPVAWHEDGASHWWIRLRCGQCGDVRDVEEVSNEQAARFERELDRGVADIAATVARIEREGADALTAALRRP